MSPRMRRMTAREVEQLWRRHGFQLVARSGSHRKWRNEIAKRQVIVPEHRGKILPIGTLRNILVNASIPESEWME